MYIETQMYTTVYVKYIELSIHPKNQVAFHVFSYLHRCTIIVRFIFVITEECLVSH